MRLSASTNAVALLAFTAALIGGCGIPKDQHDAAMADANKAKATCEDNLAKTQKEVDTLKAQLAEAEGKAGAADEATRAELDELRKQKAAAEARLRLFDEFLAKFRKMVDAGKLDITVRRGQIVLALGTDILFDTGKTEIKDDGKAALAEVAEALKTVAGRRFQVAGHTDTVPIKTKEFPSNWELSTARAVAVVKLLVEKGVKSDAVSAAGYAEFDPANSNATDKGRTKNRRIEIVVVPNIEELVKMPEVKKPGATGDAPAEAKEAPKEAQPPREPLPAKPKAPPAKPKDKKK
jgi:chemotaxis protein MotB